MSNSVGEYKPIYDSHPGIGLLYAVFNVFPERLKITQHKLPALDWLGASRSGSEKISFGIPFLKPTCFDSVRRTWIAIWLDLFFKARMASQYGMPGRRFCPEPAVFLAHDHWDRQSCMHML